MLPAHASAEQLDAAIAAVASGLAVLPADDVSAVAHDLPDPDPSAVGRQSGSWQEGDDYPLESLTPREEEVLELLADGLSNKAIATTLKISEHTAKFHVASVLAKLGVSNRAEAVRQGLRRGLVSI